MACEVWSTNSVKEVVICFCGRLCGGCDFFSLVGCAVVVVCREHDVTSHMCNEKAGVYDKNSCLYMWSYLVSDT